ncbi:hypothetical protein OG738_03455 [Amycolatopsis sp. NBC_01488]|uniref:hypothetical protein n=1 Tax=Amycolatopsis sp. NBC_01488 TaxID=2903563 RepID=UPI002E29B690|nr:hypothetical protein [Amycolatopsis sp. NBC_01488]
MATQRSSDDPEWIKSMLAKADSTTVLTSRNGIGFAHEFGDLTGVLGPALDGQPAVPDGKIVVYNEAGQIDFGLPQECRGRYQPTAVHSAAAQPGRLAHKHRTARKHGRVDSDVDAVMAQLGGFAGSRSRRVRRRLR